MSDLRQPKNVPALLGLFGTLCILAASSAAQVLPSPLSVRQLAALCGEEDPCNLIAVHDAGTDADGVELSIVVLSLDGMNDLGEVVCRPPSSYEIDERVFYLLTNRPADKPIQLLYICNDGYGMAGMGGDYVMIGDNRLYHNQYGGSAWRWTVCTEMSLSPFHLVSQHSQHGHTISGESGMKYTGHNPAGGFFWIDDSESIGRIFMSSPCGDLGIRDLVAAVAFPTLPRLPSNAFEAPLGTPLGSCSSFISEDLQPGFLVYGDRAQAGMGATLRYAMVGERDLILTVVDDHFESDGKTWIHDDHIEVWALSKEELVQWGIGIDGTIHSAIGAPPPLKVVAQRLDEEEGRARATLHLRMPWPTSSLTLVYSQAENGQQHRLFATSQFKSGKAETLGKVKDVSWPKPPLCVVRNGRIDLGPPAEQD